MTNDDIRKELRDMSNRLSNICAEISINRDRNKENSLIENNLAIASNIIKTTAIYL